MTGFPQIRDHAIVFDLEFTAWQGSVAHRWSRPGEFTELVQIGAVKVDVASLNVVDEITVLVRPRINPVLSDYLVELTGSPMTRWRHTVSISPRPTTGSCAL